MPKTRSQGVEVKSENISDDTEVCLKWHWEGDGGNWISYSDKFSDEITKVLDADKQKVVLKLEDGTSLNVLLDQMVQKNGTTGWERRIRCCVVEGSSCYCWQWLDEHGKWNPYQAKTSVLLEKGKRGAEDNVEFVAMRRPYVVDLSKMEQQNKSTSVVRKVERMLIGTISSSEASSVKASSSEASVKASSSKASVRASSSRASVKASSSKASVKASSSKASSLKDSEQSSSSNDDSDEPPAKKGKYSGGKSTKKSGRSGNGIKEEDDTIKTVVVKGRAPVDTECEASSTNHVYHEGADIYDVMLNQTNVGNNNNKFYLIQLLEDDVRKLYCVWFRWGRVGFRGQSSLTRCGPDLDQAKKVFCQKFLEKTKNDWSNRRNFSKVHGKYDMVALDYSSKTEKSEEKTPVESRTIPESKLAKEIQALIKLICDIKEMENAIIEMKYDTRKAPLGRLTVEQIKAGYSALKKIDSLIEKQDLGQRLIDACNDFYTRIPHDFRMSRPPIIRTKDEVKTKLELLEALGDIEIAMRILQASKTTENPVDSQYKSLRCDLQVLDKTDSVHKVIEDYLSNTHAPTHNQYKMNVLNIFLVDRQGEQERYKDVGNKMLLWHGSRLTNMVGIMSQGLRIAPPEAPVTGYMFGKGIYFADMSSKSANYCFATRSKNVGLLLLCEVSLGNVNELLSADYNANELPKGKHSVRGLGKIGPDPQQNVTLENGTVVPVGNPKDTGISASSSYALNYHEYIVYDISQVKMKYLVQVQFDFN